MSTKRNYSTFPQQQKRNRSFSSDSRASNKEDKSKFNDLEKCFPSKKHNEKKKESKSNETSVSPSQQQENQSKIAKSPKKQHQQKQEKNVKNRTPNKSPSKLQNLDAKQTDVQSIVQNSASKKEESINVEGRVRNEKRMRSRSKKVNEEVHLQNQDNNDVKDVVDIQLNCEQGVGKIGIQLQQIALTNKKKDAKQSKDQTNSKLEPPRKKNKQTRGNSVQPNKKDEVEFSQPVSGISSPKLTPKKTDILSSTPKETNSISNRKKKSLKCQSTDIRSTPSVQSTEVMVTTPQSHLETKDSLSKWMPLVTKTKLNTYSCNVTNSSLTDHKMFQAKKHDNSCDCQSHALIVSYDLCEIKNPLTQETEKSIIRFTVLNGNNPSEVIIDFLIKPKFPITIIQSELNGICFNDISNCEFTLSDIQFTLSMLCCSETVLIGHNLQTLLNLLQFDYPNFVDISLILRPKNQSSLNDLSQFLLKKDLPVNSDSIIRGKVIAEIANCLLREKKNHVTSEDSKTRLSQHKLLVSRIPESVTKDDIMNLFQNEFSIIPNSISDFQKTTHFYTCYLNFQSAEDVDVVYDAIPSQPEIFNSNKLQKRVILNPSGRPFFFVTKFNDNDNSAPKN